MAKAQKYLLIQAESEFFSVTKLVPEKKANAELKMLKKIHEDGIERKMNMASTFKEVTKISGSFWNRRVKKEVLRSGPSKRSVASEVNPCSIKIREIGLFEKEPTWAYEKLKQNPNWTLKDEYGK
jgi:hypothetical protein